MDASAGSATLPIYAFRLTNDGHSPSSAQLDQETSIGGTWGEVISLLGSGIDAPLAVRKTGGTTLVPHENWSGSYEIGTTADGTPTSLCNGATNCPLVLWPGSQETMDREIVTHEKLATWWGSLITGKLDATGLKYMRNRYYNPVNGQFTQQDPIGLAGGANLYGFAGGDPVNFNDPFGECIPWCSAIAGAAIGGSVAAVGTMWYNHSHGQPLRTNLVQNTLIGAGAGAAVGLGLGLVAAGSTAASAAIPTLTAGSSPRGQEMLGQAVGYLQEMPGSARVEAFREFAQQIEAATQGSWQAVQQISSNATIFAGKAGEAIAFNSAGQAFRGNIANSQQFTRTANGLVANFDKLVNIVR